MIKNLSVFFFIDDDTRVALRQLPGLQGSDYINANYIHVSFMVM